MFVLNAAINSALKETREWELCGFFFNGKEK
jgi:hypothetical protein